MDDEPQSEYEEFQLLVKHTHNRHAAMMLDGLLHAPQSYTADSQYRVIPVSLAQGPGSHQTQTHY